jgi:hypothetical protein
MAKLVIGLEVGQGQTMDLESLRRLVALADHLDFPDGAVITSNLSYVGISVGEAEIKWDTVMHP